MSEISNAPHAIGANGQAVKLIGRIDSACIEMDGHFLIDNIYISTNIMQDGIVGQTSLAAFESATFQYGGKLPMLQIQKMEKVDMVDCPPVSCFPKVPKIPVCCPSHHLSTEDKQLVHMEIKKPLAENKIKSSTSPWCSQVFIARGEGKKPHMVIDYAATVNPATPMDAYLIPLVPDLLDQVAQYKHFSDIDLKAAFHQIPLCQEE